MVRPSDDVVEFKNAVFRYAVDEQVSRNQESGLAYVYVPFTYVVS